jgi:hypothetical protein
MTVANRPRFTPAPQQGRLHRAIVAAALAAATVPAGAQAPPAGEKVVPLPIVLPQPMFVGTPRNIKVPNLEKPRYKAREPFLAPEGVKNVARRKKVVSSDTEPIVGDLAMLTDGDRSGEEGSYVELGPGKQHVTVDLGASHEVFAVVFWHFHNSPRVYLDVIVQIAGVQQRPRQHAGTRDRQGHELRRDVGRPARERQGRDRTVRSAPQQRQQRERAQSLRGSRSVRASGQVEKESEMPYTRREFGKLALAGLPATALIGGAESILGAVAQAKPNSVINGVTIGVITYSYRSMPDQSADATLKYIVDSGISAIELMGGPVESFAGAPSSGRGGVPGGGRGPGARGAGAPGAAPEMVVPPGSWKGQPCPAVRAPGGARGAAPAEGQRGGGRRGTPEQQAAMAEQQEKLKAWRTSVSMEPFKKLRKMYNDAGVSIYAWKQLNPNMSDEESPRRSAAPTPHSSSRPIPRS